MYERSAIVLERYIEKILDFDKSYNLKKNSESYSELIHEIENYQTMTNKELAFIQEFDEKVRKIEELQREQERLSKTNKSLEEERIQLFSDLGEDANTLENKLKKKEIAIERNNERLKEIREKFIQDFSDFSQKQKERNKSEKARRIGEAKHVEYVKKAHEEFSEINVEEMVNLKDFINSEKEQVKDEALQIMIKNGRNEKVAFNQDVLKKAIKARIDIAEKEAECYILVYDKMKKLLQETDNEFVKLNKHQKTLRDTSVKLAFLKAEKEYIVGLLDYERMTAVSGAKAHKRMMIEACNNFELDMLQIKDLYELLLKEVASKATQKAYTELYNKDYLKGIEDKERNFEKEVNNVNISMGTVINSNYWRIEGIKNIYEVFQKEVSEKFGKDLSAYRIEELDEYEEDEYEQEEENSNQLYKFKIYDDDDDNDNENNLYKFKIYEHEEDEEDDEEEFEDYDDYEDEEEEYYDDKYEETDYDDEDEDDNEYEDYEEDEDEEDEDEDEDEEFDILKFSHKKKEERQKGRRKEKQEENTSKEEKENNLEEEESLETLIERSRKRGMKERQEKDNKGLFNKLFKK